MLEKDAQILIRGADAFGRKVKRDLKPKSEEQPDRVVVPVIVTNAKLFEAKYDPCDVSLETGQLPSTPSPEISPVEWVRFRKAFTTGGSCDRMFVVAASSLQRFLHDLDTVSPRPSSRGIYVS
jgi:hypothetical protein